MSDERDDSCFDSVGPQHTSRGMPEHRRIAELEQERDDWRSAWLKVCQEGNVPQYEKITNPHPNGILHGVRQLASMWSAERLLRESLERERDEARGKAERAARLVHQCIACEREWHGELRKHAEQLYDSRTGEEYGIDALVSGIGEQLRLLRERAEKAERELAERKRAT